jgi:putative ABC transport system permease protein
VGSGRGGVSTEVHTEDGRVYAMLDQRSDEDFLETFEIALIAGRNFRQGDKMLPNQNESPRSVLLNETAVGLLGWKDPIGKQLFKGTRRFTVIGVVRDFHMQSLRDEIKPLFLSYGPTLFRRLGLKIRGENLPETLAFMEKTWKQFVPEKPFEFMFIDENINQMYGKEQKVGQLVGMFALLAIVVACLGLFGLVAFTAEQRTKEIGIRKVLGASVRSIVLLLSTEFARLVLIANLIAWPVAYFLVDDWLQNFSYRVDVAWWEFALSGMIALLIALGTVGYQALRAAVANPVEALRNE